MDQDTEDYQRLPGLYRPWDLVQVIQAGRKYQIEDVGVLADGGALFAIWASVQPGGG